MAAKLKLINKDFCWATRDKFNFSRHCGVSSIRDSRIFGCCSCQREKKNTKLHEQCRTCFRLSENVIERRANVKVGCFWTDVKWHFALRFGSYLIRVNQAEFFCSILFRDRVVIRFMAANRSTVPPFIANFSVQYFSMKD